MTGLMLATVLVAPAAPPPQSVTPATPNRVDENQTRQFANLVDILALEIQVRYVRDSLTAKELVEGAIRGLYDEVGLPLPEHVLAEARKADTQIMRSELLFKVRMALGNHPNLAGSRSLFAAINGFRHATDSSCNLVSARVNDYASIDQDFGIGIELDGVVGTRWAIYQAEYGVAATLYPAHGYIGVPPKADAVPSPATFPWRVRRVIPGSPAQKQGILPGDVITHLNGTEITAEKVDALFAGFANPRQAFDPRTGTPLPQDRTFTYRRGEETPVTVTLKSGRYTPESVFGVWRLPEDKWDCLLDREHKIGYIRLGPIETGVDTRFENMMADLVKQQCRGLILDLRWCPGGYVDPGTRIAGMFLDDGAIVTKMVITHPQRVSPGGDVLAPLGGGRYKSLPLVVLVGSETTGGGELIASAIRDNNRCTVIGQRTVGRAMIQNTFPAGFANLQYRFTTGTSLRPNGKVRQRTPESQPTDDWGIRPDDGLEVPITADKSAELRRQADLHSIRPADSREALPFDDPAGDPYRLAALAYLRKKLGPSRK